MATRIVDNVDAAFELLMEELAKVRHDASNDGAAACGQSDYRRAKEAIGKAESLEQISKELSKLQVNWHLLLRPEAEAEAEAKFIIPQRPNDDREPSLSMAYNGTNAKALYNRGSVILLELSTICRPAQESLLEKYRSMRDECESDGRLVPNGESHFLKVTRPIQFHSPSGAAQFVAGCSVSGNREWRVDGTKQTLGEWLRQNGRQ